MKDSRGLFSQLLELSKRKKEMVGVFSVAWPEEEREMQKFLTLPYDKQSKVFLAPLTPI